MTLYGLRTLLTIGVLGLTMNVVGCTEEVLPQAEEVEIYTARSRTRAKTSHLLLSYEGAWRANTRRTKEDAQRQAEAYLEQIKTCRLWLSSPTVLRRPAKRRRGTDWSCRTRTNGS